MLKLISSLLIGGVFMLGMVVGIFYFDQHQDIVVVHKQNYSDRSMLQASIISSVPHD